MISFAGLMLCFFYLYLFLFAFVDYYYYKDLTGSKIMFFVGVVIAIITYVFTNLQ